MTSVGHPALFRFVWKEYRTLRGFWLAMGGLALLPMLVSKILAEPGWDQASFILGTAQLAAALYAMGAAATLFSVEHEEETFAFLSGLPVTWPVPFWGKVTTALVGAVALAAAL